jgi:hypothetical protein
MPGFNSETAISSETSKIKNRKTRVSHIPNVQFEPMALYPEWQFGRFISIVFMRIIAIRSGRATFLNRSQWHKHGHIADALPIWTKHDVTGLS